MCNTSQLREVNLTQEGVHCSFANSGREVSVISLEKSIKGSSQISHNGLNSLFQSLQSYLVPY